MLSVKVQLSQGVSLSGLTKLHCLCLHGTRTRITIVLVISMFNDLQEEGVVRSVAIGVTINIRAKPFLSDLRIKR